MIVRVYLACVSQFYINSRGWETPDANAPLHRALLSYLPTFKDAKKLEMALHRTAQPVDYCVDSGAHVWLAAFFKKNEKAPISQVEKTLQNFMTSIKSLPRKPTFVVELDLQRIYGMDVINAWRRDLWKPFEAETGIRVCYVWHAVDGVQRWGAMLNDPEMRYLGMGSDRRMDVSVRAKLCHAAYAAAKPVHGFASVDTKWMKQVPFYSVDSTSWAVGAQVFGLAPMFDQATGKIRQVHVGNRQFAKDPKVAAANLIQARSFFPSDILEKKDGKKNYPRFFATASSVFEQLEKWHTAWWCVKGLDWEVQLKKHGNEVAGFGGGHLTR